MITNSAGLYVTGVVAIIAASALAATLVAGLATDGSRLQKWALRAILSVAVLLIGSIFAVGVWLVSLAL